MSSPITISEIKSALQGLCDAVPTNLGIEISLPVMFPDGDLASVIVAPEAENFVVHDSASAMMYLATLGITLSSDAEKRLRPLIAKYGCELHYDTVTRRCVREDIAVAATMVANASRTIADRALDSRRGAERCFRDAVTDRIRAVVGERVRVNEEVRGFSGRSWRVHNIILDPARSRPVAYVEPVANRNGVTAHFAEFFDIQKAQGAVRTIIVYDEYSDIRDEDRKLLESVGEVVAFGASKRRLLSLAA